jgi:hypothetical protein
MHLVRLVKAGIIQEGNTIAGMRLGNIKDPKKGARTKEVFDIL